MKIVKGGITKPSGFLAGGIACGIKASGKPDLGVIFSQVPCVCAAVYTKNSVKAAPLLVTEKHLRNGIAQAVIVNSGNANCMTGDRGLADARQMAEFAADCFGIKLSDVIVASTGIIGRLMPMEKILRSAEAVEECLKISGSANFEKSILTTDLIKKTKVVEIKIGGRIVTIAGTAKGSGMIAPNMATMLAFITTDAAIDLRLLKRALAQALEQSFNCISVDGCMSTNDMAVVMANGLAANPLIKSQGKDFQIFLEALTFVCLDLAKKIVMDGEGATKFITVNVKQTKTDQQAKTIALAIANSALVKTAAYGSNPNWGRVAAAVGSLGISSITEKNLKVKFSSFKKRNIDIQVTLGLGNGAATVYTSDLSKEYVRINGDYN